jgi:plasmid stabilization system protein ParE
MSYELVITDEAVEDLHALIDSLPRSRRRDALESVDAALARLAANPRLGQRQYLGRKAFHFPFRAGEVSYHWGCTFMISEDEARLVVTHIFRAAL